MILRHAEKHLDKIKFPTNQGQSYILERGKYTKIAYGKLQKNWMNAEDAVQEAYLYALAHPVKKHLLEEEFEALFMVILQGVIGRMYRNDKAKERNSCTNAGKYLQYLEVEEESDIDEYANREEIVALANEDTNPELALLAKEVLGDITLEIDRLKFIPRQIIALNVLYGYKPREIHDVTGDNPAKIRKIIQRFRNTMKRKL